VTQNNLRKFILQLNKHKHKVPTVDLPQKHNSEPHYSTPRDELNSLSSSLVKGVGNVLYIITSTKVLGLAQPPTSDCGNENVPAALTFCLGYLHFT